MYKALIMKDDSANTITLPENKNTIFRVTNASLRVIKQGRQNAGNKYLIIELVEDTPLANEFFTRYLFINQSLIAQWEEAIRTNNFPKFNGIIVVEKNLPLYVPKKNDGSVIFSEPMNAMRVVVRAENGKPIEDSRKIAMWLIKSQMKLV